MGRAFWSDSPLATHRLPPRFSLERLGIVRGLHAFEISWAQRGEGKAKMQASELPRAVAAASSTASALDLTVDDAIVLQDSNRLVLRLIPCDVAARVAPMAHQASAELEVELARRFAGSREPGGCARASSRARGSRA
jgi:hypothetical protein